LSVIVQTEIARFTRPLDIGNGEFVITCRRIRRFFDCFLRGGDFSIWGVRNLLLTGFSRFQLFEASV
jgi:hypothetical protein